MDVVNVIVKDLGVKVELWVINLVNCILLLIFKKVDLIVVNFIIIDDCVKEVNFSLLYFVIG